MLNTICNRPSGRTLIAFLCALSTTVGSYAQPQWPATDPSNIALFKPAKQINTLDGQHADRAVDGNNSGDSGAHRSISHTQDVANPWWEVDLLAAYDISAITIFNRTDCCSERLHNFVILVSQEPFDGNYGGEVFSNDGSPFTGSKTFSGAGSGQYIRIYLQGNGMLTLAEVVVRGKLVQPDLPMTKGENLALGKRARQSSVLEFCGANRTNDGDTEGNYGMGSGCHTQGESKPWWEVDLGKKYLIEEVKVHGRTDCCSDRLSNFNIWVTDRPKDQIQRRIVPFAQEEKNFLPAQFRAYTGKQIGRYVRVQLNGTNSLELAEVQVFGTEVGDISQGDAESNVMYKVSIFRNASPTPSTVRSTVTKSISEGMDFKRTVSQEDKSQWSLSTTARATVNYAIVALEMELTFATSNEVTKRTETAQGNTVQESESTTTEIEQVVPGGSTRYEFHKFTINQSPINYKFQGETYSWFRINEKATATNDITVMVFPNNEAPALKTTDGNWILPSQYQKLQEAHPDYVKSGY